VFLRSTGPGSGAWRVPFDGLTIRTALVISFGVTLALWLLAGVYFTRRMAEVERRAAAINERYLRAQDRLSTVRAQVLLGSVYLRDALMDPKAGGHDEYRRQMEDAYTAAAIALRQYEPVMDSPEEREHLRALERSVEEFRATVLDVLATDNRDWYGHARELLRDRIVPKRQSVIQVSEEVQALNRNQFVEQQKGIAAVYASTERQVWLSLGFVLIVSFGIAGVATIYATRLERRLRHQQQIDLQTSRDLQRLSARVVNAQEEERRVIARELHDEIGQVLTAIKVEMSVARRRVQEAGGPAHLLEGPAAIADRALRSVRDLSHLLHPALLDDLGLPAAVELYLKGIQDRTELKVDLLLGGMEGRLASETELAAYRIIQEALTNVLKHADAASCQVYLQRLSDTLLVTIDDDGKGFDPATIGESDARPGLGLIGIRERVTHLSGTLRLETAPGKGTRLTVELPIGVTADEQVDHAPAGTPVAAAGGVR
jgi:signal transduction histidine kinase